MFPASAAPRAATFAYVNPLVAVFLGWLILGEPVGPAVRLGTLIIVPGPVPAVCGPSRRR